MSEGCLFVIQDVYSVSYTHLGNNPMVGATVAVAVSVEEAAKAGRF